MSYAIIRNDKLTRVDAQGSYIHNDSGVRIDI